MRELFYQDFANVVLGQTPINSRCMDATSDAFLKASSRSVITGRSSPDAGLRGDFDNHIEPHSSNGSGLAVPADLHPAQSRIEIDGGA